MQQHLVLTVQEAREWTRIDADADTNLLQNLIFAVQEHAAQYLGRRLDPIDCPRPVKHAIAVMVADMYASVTFVPQSGVTLTAPNGVLAISEQYGTAYLVKTNTNLWSVVPAVPFNSPAFSGTPTAPTAASGDNSSTLATTAHVKSAITAAFVPREITYEMFHPNHGGISQFYYARVAETVQITAIYGAIAYSTTATFSGTGAPSWGTVSYLNPGQQASVSITAGGTMRLEFSGDAQGIPRWCHVRRTSGGS